jgi:hypothetical protein
MQPEELIGKINLGHIISYRVCDEGGYFILCFPDKVALTTEVLQTSDGDEWCCLS